MPVLSYAEYKMVAEIVTELARSRSRTTLESAAIAADFAQAALIDPAFKARLTEVHRRLDVWRVVKESRPILEPIAPLLLELEREVEVILSVGKP